VKSSSGTFIRQALLLVAALLGVATSAFSAPESGLRFNGTDNYVEMPSFIPQFLDGTIEAWIRVDADGLDSRRRLFGTGPSGRFFHLAVSTDGRLELVEEVPIWSHNTPGYPMILNLSSPPGVITSGQWHHVALTQRVDSDVFEHVPDQTTVWFNRTLYVDGQKVGVARIGRAASTSWHILPGDSPLNVGGSFDFQGAGTAGPGPWYSFQPFKGEIAQLRYWQVERTQAEIASNMDQSLPVDDGNGSLVAVWPMDDPGSLPHIADIHTPTPNLNFPGTYHGPIGNLATEWADGEATAIDIGVGNDGTRWIVDGEHNVHRNIGGGWENMGLGGASRLDVDPQGNAWVVMQDNSIKAWHPGGWYDIPGAALDIGVGADGSGSVWVIGANPIAKVWLYNPSVEGKWIDMLQDGKRLGVASNGQAYVVREDGTIWHYIGARDGSNIEWVEVDRSLRARDIGLGGPSIWAVAQDGSVHRWSDAVNDWQQTSGQAYEISVDQNGYAWAIEAGTRRVLRGIGQ
jgi:hypothetical protein